MADSRQLIRCSRCQKEFEYGQVRYIPGTAKMSCKACLGAPEQLTVSTRPAEERRFTYQCPKCRYQFRRAVDHQPMACPQCGWKELLRFEPEKLTSDKLLRMADDPRLDRYAQDTTWERSR